MASEPVDLSRPPHGWHMTRTEAGDIRLMRPSFARGVIAVVCWSLAALVSYVWVGRGAGPGWARSAPVLFGLSLFAAAWCTWAREDWIARRGRLLYRLTFGPWCRLDPFEDATLTITHTVSSEDDYLYRLVVRSGSRSRTFESSVVGEKPLVESAR